jgi:hypothetical protein
VLRSADVRYPDLRTCLYIRVGDGDYVWSEELWLAPGVLSRVSIPQAVT